MKDYLKVYNGKLHVLTPTFIGSGNEISKKEYRLDLKNKKAIVYDPGKMYTIFRNNRLQRQFEDYLLDSKSSDLNYWLQKNKIDPDELTPAIKYVINCGDRLESGNSKVQIMEFIKDPYGMPYIPGSSIKGALRTVLLGYEISKNPGKYKNVADKISSYKPRVDKPDKKYYKKDAEEAESIAFRTLNIDEKHPNDAVNDTLKGLIISDSKPVSVNNLVLCQKVDYNTESEPSPLNLLRECLIPGTDIEFSITIDTTTCKYDIDTIMKAIKVFNDTYFENFQSKFTKLHFDDTLYIGGGVGFVSKTFIYSMFTQDDGVKVTTDIFRNTLNQKIFIEHKHANDPKLGVSPHTIKYTKLNDKRYQMGICRFEYEEQ